MSVPRLCSIITNVRTTTVWHHTQRQYQTWPIERVGRYLGKVVEEGGLVPGHLAPYAISVPHIVLVRTEHRGARV
eukprot:3685077-Rhodomonas_salina.1